MKFQRQIKILELIEASSVETQEELSEKLKESGYDVTQATVSRDIKELRLIKTLSDNGAYRYAASMKEPSANTSSKFRVIFKESVRTVDCAGNMVVIKTFPGMAQAAAASLDAMDLSEVVGTLAGDDTILIIVRSIDGTFKLSEELSKILK